MISRVPSARRRPGATAWASRSGSATTPACASSCRRLPRRPRRPRRPPPPANRPPTVKARCEPCTVQVGQNATVTADANDPDGDTLTYRWTAPTGTFANAADRQTPFTCPAQPGGVPVTVTVNDGKGGTASDTITIQCTQPPRKEYTFEDVHFDFDRYTLRAEATRVLDDAIKAMQADRHAAPHGRRPHLQHRHDRVQPGPRRTPRGRRARLPLGPWHRRGPSPDRQLRRRASEARQQPRRDAPPEPPRRSHGATAVTESGGSGDAASRRVQEFEVQGNELESIAISKRKGGPISIDPPFRLYGS